MNIRIVSALVVAGLSCLTVSACSLPALEGIRPQIARPLQEALTTAAQPRRGGYPQAIKEVQAVQAIPNQTEKEKVAVAEVKSILIRNHEGGNFPPVGDENSQNYLPPNYSPNPPDQTPNVPHPY